jgi:hypothetical protein
MHFSLLKIVRSGLAMALGLWVAGAGCLLGCEGMMTAAAASESAGSARYAKSELNLDVSGEACASARSHDCCAKRNHRAQTKAPPSEKQAAPLVETESSSSGMAACPLAMSRTLVAAKKSGGETSSVTIVAKANLPALSLLEQTTPLVTQLRLPNRGHTYLRCCSFLI